MDDEKKEPRASSSPSPRTGFAFLGGGLAWTFHLLAAWYIVELGCNSELADVNVLGISLVIWAVLIVSLIGLAVGSLALFFSFAYLRDSSDGKSASRIFLHRTAVVLNLVFTLTILAQSIPVFYFLDGCR